LKELAISHGTTWTLKSGIPEEVFEKNNKKKNEYKNIKIFFIIFI